MLEIYILVIIAATLLFWSFLWHKVQTKNKYHKAWLYVSMRIGSDTYTLRQLLKFKKFYNFWYDIRNLIPWLEIESKKMYRMSLIMDKAIDYIHHKVNENQK